MIRKFSILFTTVVLTACASVDLDRGVSIFDRAAGTWDEEDAESCLLSHKVSFTEDRLTMIHTYLELGHATAVDSRKSFRYSIVSLSESELFASLEDEQRLTDSGDAVIWIFRMMDDDTYCWGRVDWPAGSCTPMRRRCEH